MPYKDKEFQKAKVRMSQYAKREFVRQYKRMSVCDDCGVPYHYWQLQFDHVEERGVKEFELGDAYNQGWVRIFQEILKCDVTCANCHANRSAVRDGLT